MIKEKEIDQQKIQSGGTKKKNREIKIELSEKYHVINVEDLRPLSSVPTDVFIYDIPRKFDQKDVESIIKNFGKVVWFKIK